MTSQGTAASGLGQERVDELTSSEFVEMLVARAWSVAEDLYDPGAYSAVAINEATRRENLVRYLRRRAWAEWYFGTVTPARQIQLLPTEEIALKLRLARQIADEVRHHDAFSAEARRFGGEWRVERFDEPAALRRMHDSQRASLTAGELAAANQLSGEVVLGIHTRVEGNVLRDVLPAHILELIDDIETDEPAHVSLGADIAQLYARDPVERHRMVAAQERFLDGLFRQHATELGWLGAERVRPLPTAAPVA